MIKRGSVLFGSALAMILGCGDDAVSNGTGGAGGAGTTGVASTGTGLPGTGSVSASSGSTGAGGDPAGVGGATSSAGGGSSEGGGGSGPGVGGSGGAGTFDSPCGAICDRGGGCDEAPPEPSEECIACVLDEAAGATESECTVEGATSPCCQEVDACNDFVVCVVGGSTFDECAEGNAEGYAQATTCVLATCGECGDTGEGGGGGGETGGGGEGGAGSFDSPCGEICSTDDGCDADPPAPTGDCAECVQAEADQGVGSQCAIAGATGSCCQDDAACSDYIDCVLGGGTQAECAEDNAAGAEQARVCVLASCGECGGDGAGGGGQAGPPCEAACADDAGCDADPANPSGECASCIQGEQDAQSGCVIQGAASPCCQDDGACVAFIDCVQGGTSTTLCGLLNLPGAARAQECIRSSCGACGDP